MRRAAWIAAGVLLAANALAFAGIAWNRSATTAELTLTERELAGAYAGPESTAVGLRLVWETEDSRTLLNRESLARLGFDTGRDPGGEGAARWYERQLPRDAYVVLEYDGEAWQRGLAEKRRALEELERKAAGEVDPEAVERERKALASFRANHSRLFAVAVGRNPAELRRRFPDRGRYLVLRTVVAIGHGYGEGGEERVIGRFRGVRPDVLHVPHGQRSPVRSTLDGERQTGGSRFAERRQRSQTGPRYRVTVRNGRHHVPWVAEVAPAPGKEWGD